MSGTLEEINGIDVMIDKHNESERNTTANSTFAIGGDSCSANRFVVAESFVLQMNICAKKPAHRKSAKPLWLILKDDTTNAN